MKLKLPMFGAALGAALGATLLAAGCASTGAYPRDLFIEMHYQQSWRAQEPPRLYPAQGAVPVTGREVDPGSFEDARLMVNPVPLTPETLARGKDLFSIDCAVCHGPAGRGASVMASLFRAAAAAPPVDLAGERVKGRTPGQLYWVLTNGLGNMPPFGRLLTPEERWTLVHFVRSVGQ
ncbi:MAG: c-type cytochrome [Chloroflexi bacterium]|nr:c-type cytochrome [Chloroflexota bacterium]